MDGATRGQVVTQPTIQQLIDQYLVGFKEVYPECRPGHDLKARVVCDKAGRRANVEYFSASDEDPGHEEYGIRVAKSGKGEGSPPGLAPRTLVSSLDEEHRPNSHQTTLSFRRATGKLNTSASNPTVTTTTPRTTPVPPLIPTAPPRIKFTPTEQVRIKFIPTPPLQDNFASQQTHYNHNHPETTHVSNPQRPQVPGRLFSPHQDPESSHDLTAGYLRSYPPPSHSSTPVPFTPCPSTISLPPSPLVRLAAGGDNLKRLRNIGSPFSHPFPCVHRTTPTATRTPFVAEDLYDPDVTQGRVALREHIYALNHATVSPAHSIPPPSLAPPPVSSPPFAQPPMPSDNLWTFVPTMRGPPGLDLGVEGSQDLTIYESGLRKRERQVDHSTVQERSVSSRGPRNQAIAPLIDSSGHSHTSPGMTNHGEGRIGEVNTHVEGNPSEWSDRDSDRLPFQVPCRSVSSMRGLDLGIGQSEEPAMSGPNHKPIPTPLPPSSTKGLRGRMKTPISINPKVVQCRLTNGGPRTNFIPPRTPPAQSRDTSPEMTEENSGSNAPTCIVGDTEKRDSDCVNGVGETVKVKDVAWDQEARIKPQSLEVLFSSGIPMWEVLVNFSLTMEERISLITAIFSGYKETEVVKGLAKADAQSFVDALDETLDSLGPQLRNRCLGTICKICGRHGLLPKSIQIPPCYDRLDFPLYHGGYAEVWEGEYEGCKVAVKVLKIYQTSDLDKIKRRFCKEVMAWKTLRHRNVLPLLGVTMSGNQFAMASEWMANGNIVEFVKAHRDIDRFELLKDVVQGSIYIHSEGMAHGDLKGANILINKCGSACIADFGLAAIISDPAYSATSTSFANAGTIRWMSPERLNPIKFSVKDGCPTKESDCYALGMVILEVLTGKVPFAQDNMFVVMQKVLTGERPERPEGVWFTDELWGTLEVCWSPQQSDRPTAEAVLECLMRVSPALVPPSTEDGSHMFQ